MQVLSSQLSYSFNSTFVCNRYILLVTTGLSQLLRLYQQLAACFLLSSATAAKHPDVVFQSVTISKYDGTIQCVCVLLVCLLTISQVLCGFYTANVVSCLCHTGSYPLAWTLCPTRVYVQG